MDDLKKYSWQEKQNTRFIQGRTAPLSYPKISMQWALPHNCQHFSKNNMHLIVYCPRNLKHANSWVIDHQNNALTVLIHNFKVAYLLKFQSHFEFLEQFALRYIHCFAKSVGNNFEIERKNANVFARCFSPWKIKMGIK